MKKMMNKVFNKKNFVANGMEEAYVFTGAGQYEFDTVFTIHGRWALRVSFNFDVACEELDTKMTVSKKLILSEFSHEINAYKAIKMYQEEESHRERMIKLMENKAQEEIIERFDENALRNLKYKYHNKSFDIKVELNVDKSLLKKGSETDV